MDVEEWKELLGKGIYDNIDSSFCKQLNKQICNKSFEKFSPNLI